MKWNKHIFRGGFHIVDVDIYGQRADHPILHLDLDNSNTLQRWAGATSPSSHVYTIYRQRIQKVWQKQISNLQEYVWQFAITATHQTQIDSVPGPRLNSKNTRWM
jgi:hypothetical protein